MNVSLTPQLEDLIDLKVKSGRYGSASEVVREALRLLEERDNLQAARLSQLRADVQQGLDQIDTGKATKLDKKQTRALASDIKAAGRRKASRR